MKRSLAFLVSVLCAAGTAQAVAATLGTGSTQNQMSAPVRSGQSEVVKVGHLGVCDTAIACGNPPSEESEAVTVGHLGVCDTAIGCGNPPAQTSEAVKVGKLGVCDTAIGCDFSEPAVGGQPRSME